MHYFISLVLDSTFGHNHACTVNLYFHALHSSSFLPSLAYQRRNTFSDSPHHSKVPRHPHPSTAYPNFSLSCTKLHLPHPSPRSHNHTLGNCVLRFTHGSREHDITSPARLQVHLAELRLLDPHQLLWTYRQNHGHSPYTCPTKSTTTIPPSPGPVADCEPNNQRVGMERETEVPPQLHQKRNSNRSDRVYTVTRMYRKTGLITPTTLFVCTMILRNSKHSILLHTHV